MGLNKFKRFIGIAISFAVLLVFPIIDEIYFTTLYYAVVIILIPISIYRIVFEGKFDKRFQERWHKARNQGFWINVVREGMRSFVMLTMVVGISQFLGNGRTPVEIVSKLSGIALIWIFLLLLAFSLLGGIVAWHENNKRYNRINYGMENNTK